MHAVNHNSATRAVIALSWHLGEQGRNDLIAESHAQGREAQWPQPWHLALALQCKVQTEDVRVLKYVNGTVLHSTCKQRSCLKKNLLLFFVFGRNIQYLNLLKCVHSGMNPINDWGMKAVHSLWQYRTINAAGTKCAGSVGPADSTAVRAGRFGSAKVPLTWQVHGDY